MAVVLPSAAAFACTKADSSLRDCPAVGGSVHGGSVELDGSATEPGDGGHVRSDTGPRGDNSIPAAPVVLHCPLVDGACVGGRDGYTVTSPGAVVPGGPITVLDLVNFTPVAGIDQMEPNGWAVVGLDTNFFATAAVHVEQGFLLGQQASVRFTPVAYHWAYGDGGTANRRTGGSTWAAQGLAEFDHTATSHVYQKAGDYNITLTVEFGAEYQIAGGPWAGISGTVPSPANELRITAGKTKTVLVEQDCHLNPSGPGC
jgi:hypothetical protein